MILRGLIVLPGGTDGAAVDDTGAADDTGAVDDTGVTDDGGAFLARDLSDRNSSNR